MADDVKEIKIEFECLPGGGQGQNVEKVEVTLCTGKSMECEKEGQISFRSGPNLPTTWGPQDLSIESGSGCVKIGGMKWCW